MKKWQLQQLQGLPLEVKIRKTQERIKEWYEHFNGQVYVSFSGGKDSTVLLHIAREMYPEIEAVFVDTGLEYPEIREFVKGFENVTWLKPKMNFKEVIEKYGYPVISKEVSQAIYEARSKPDGAQAKKFDPIGSNDNKYGARYCLERYRYLRDSEIPISHKCCKIIKKEPCNKYSKESGKHPMIATMTDESQLRENTWLRYGCNAYDGKEPKTTPMSFWMEQDIFHYLQNNIPMASCYGEIIEADQMEGQSCLDGCMSHLTTSKCKRTGCMFCMFGVHLEKEPNRFQMMKETHPKQYDYCINKLGLGEVLDYIKVKY